MKPLVEYWVICFRDLSNMPALLAGLRATPIPHHIVVWDNSLDERVAAELRGLMLDGETLVVSPENRMCFGASQAMLDMRVTDAPFIAYVCSTHSFILDPTWVCDCIAVLEHVPRGGMAGYLLKIPGLFWFKAAFCGGRETLRLPAHFPLLEGRWTREEIFERADTQVHIQGGVWVCRREALLDIGGFEQAIQHTFGDVELAVRMQMGKWALCGVDTVYSEHNNRQMADPPPGMKIIHVYQRPSAKPEEAPSEVTFVPEEAKDVRYLDGGGTK